MFKKITSLNFTFAAIGITLLLTVIVGFIYSVKFLIGELKNSGENSSASTESAIKFNIEELKKTGILGSTPSAESPTGTTQEIAQPAGQSTSTPAIPVISTSTTKKR